MGRVRGACGGGECRTPCCGAGGRRAPLVGAMDGTLLRRLGSVGRERRAGR